MPDHLGEAYYLDVRVGPMLVLLVLVGLARGAEAAPAWPESSAAVWAGGCLALLVALLNLVYLEHRVTPEQAWFSRYRALLGALPQHGRVLPIYTAHKQGGLLPFFHADSFVVIDRAGLTPYLFTGDRGFPMKYFRYTDRPYAPDEEWYSQHSPVDWSQVAKQYEYLVVTKPFDPQRISVPTQIAAENDVAVVLSLRNAAHASVVSAAASWWRGR
jgi:hypothetical protein